MLKVLKKMPIVPWNYFAEFIPLSQAITEPYLEKVKLFKLDIIKEDCHIMDMRQSSFYLKYIHQSKNRRL